jgi:hypothetical protein
MCELLAEVHLALGELPPLEDVVEADLPDVVQVKSQHRPVQVLQEGVLLLLRCRVHFK